MQLADIFPIVNTAEPHKGSEYCDPATGYWEKLYDNYLRADQSGPRSQPFHFRSFGDGGYLDNKPFSSAIDTILTRPTALPVDRKLVYIEPNPEGLIAQRDDATRPNAVENSLAALLFLPRYETIRDDLERVVNRNLEIERVDRVVTDVRKLLSDSDDRIELNPYKYSSGYASYQRLRVSSVTDELANLLSREYRVNPNGAFGKAVRTLASVWRERRYGDTRKQRLFLYEFDVEYRLRRIRYLHRCIQAEYRELKYARGPAAKDVAGDFETYRQVLRKIRGALGPSYAALQGLLRNPFPPNELPQKAFTTEHMSLVAEPPEEPERWKKLETHARAMEPSEHGARQRAEYVFDNCQRMDIANELAKTVAARFGPVLKGADNFIRDGFDEDAFQTPAALSASASAFARTQWQKFEFYDSVTFPINFGTNVDGFGPVSIHRVSPVDATARDDALQGYPKLRGQALGSFGGFFDLNWRRNDMLWGRLDGAERLIVMVLPERDPSSTELRNKLVDRAHEEIVSEFLELNKERRPQWKQELRAYIAKLPEQPDRQLVASSAARCVAVIGSLLEGISDGYAARAKPLFARMALIGRLVWNFIEVSVPDTFGELVGNHWMQLLVLFVAMLGALALITASALPLALPVAVGVLVLFFLRQRLRRYLRGDELLAPAEISALTVLATVGLTSLIIYLVNIPWPSDWGHLRRPEVGPPAAGIGQARDYLWSFVLLGCSLFMTVLSGMWRFDAVHHARSFNKQLNVIGKLKFSRRWQDVADAFGLSSQTQSRTEGSSATGEAKNDDRSALRAAACAAVIRASSFHGAIVRALGADYVFTTAYALALVATALCIVSIRHTLWDGWVLSAVMYGVLGLCALAIAAAGANMVVDGRILRVLRERLPENREEVLRAPPFRYNWAKWAMMAFAVVSVIVWVCWVLWGM